MDRLTKNAAGNHVTHAIGPEVKWIDKKVRHTPVDMYNFGVDADGAMKLTFAAASLNDPARFVVSDVMHVPAALVPGFFELAARMAHQLGIVLPPPPVKQ